MIQEIAVGVPLMRKEAQGDGQVGDPGAFEHVGGSAVQGEVETVSGGVRGDVQDVVVPEGEPFSVERDDHAFAGDRDVRVAEVAPLGCSALAGVGSADVVPDRAGRGGYGEEPEPAEGRELAVLVGNVQLSIPPARGWGFGVGDLSVL